MNQETITQRAQAITTLRRTKVEAPIRPLQEDLRDAFADDVFEYSPSEIIAFRINSANGWGRGVRAARRAAALVDVAINTGVYPPQFDQILRASRGLNAVPETLVNF